MDSEQPSFTDVEYGNRRRVSRREQFLETMDATLPWARWVGLIVRPGSATFGVAYRLHARALLVMPPGAAAGQ